MWQLQSQPLPTGTGKLARIQQQGTPLTFREVLQLWRSSPEFREFYSRCLTEETFPAFFWETPAVHLHTLDQPFEWVVIHSPALARVQAEPQVFAAHFGSAAAVVSFPNLGGDARLVVPRPMSAASRYPHLAAFLRTAPTDQMHALWQTVSETMTDHLSEQPTWLSTAGMGVFWVHIRLDSRPKYYRHQPYRRG